MKGELSMKPTIYQCAEPKAVGTPPVLKQELSRADHHDFNIVQVEPGAGKSPHPYSAGGSFMLVISGELLLEVDGEKYTLNPSDVAFIPKGAARGFVAGTTGATFFAAHLRD